jgi:flavin reductase (DIM6/NTAB) family NADH-FMN oxidoreductase RutF
MLTVHGDPFLAEAAGGGAKGEGEEAGYEQYRAHAAGIILSGADLDLLTMPPPDPAQFREAMSALPTGVTVVAASGADGPAGATANAVCSLSIEPMLMLACLDRGSRTLLAVQAADRFGISLLHAGQEEIARAFATKAPVPEKWSGVAWSERAGVPAIDDALAWLACDLRDVIAAGDHVIVTGEVREMETSEGDPLVFYGGEYRPLG